MSERKYLDESGLKQVFKYITDSTEGYTYCTYWFESTYLKNTTISLIDNLLKKKLISQPIYLTQTDGSINNLSQYSLETNFSPGDRTIPNFLVYSLNSNDSVGISPMSLY